MMLSVTYYLNYALFSLFIVYLIFYQQVPNWLFGHYRTLTTNSLGETLH